MSAPDSLPSLRRALVSVSDKKDLVGFVRFLVDRGVEILSTGGSAALLSAHGIPVREVSDFTGFPELMDGRVKTLHPKVHGGLLGIRSKVSHREQMESFGIEPIDLLVVNLYPFEATVAAGAPFPECVENIDIGGPAMIRAAAKNHDSVTVVVDPADYGRVMEDMQAHAGATSADLRRQLAAAAYARTACYDAAIASWFSSQVGTEFPTRMAFSGTLSQVMRYGENPHQSAALYTNGEQRPGVATAHQIQGKELSYNNFNDTDAAFELVAEFSQTACVIVKHANPCGVAIADTVRDAYRKALSCDRESAFGGIVAFNRPLDGETATDLCDLFLEVIIAPAIDPEARRILATKKNVRVLETSSVPDPRTAGLQVKTIAGGLLVQSRDALLIGEDLKVVSKRKPSEREMRDMIFAFSVGKHVKSNAIVYARDLMTVGIGAGQMSRVNSSRIAAFRAAQAAEAHGEDKSWAVGSVVSSDAFFPFADGLLAAAEAGATAVIQPGGSIRDGEVIQAADDAGLAMVFTGMRHFRH